MEHSEAIEVDHGVGWLAPVLVIGLLLGGAAFWGANKQILGLFHDDAIYTVVGQAMADGDGYHIVSLPTAPAQTKYPFLYSSLIAGLWKLAPAFPQNIGLLKSLNIAIFVGIFFLSVVYYRRESSVSNVGAIVFGFLICANPILFSFTDFVLSDLLLVLLTLIALTIASDRKAFSPFEKAGLGGIFLKRGVQIPPDPPFSKGGSDDERAWLVENSHPSWSRLVVLAVVTGLACLTRTAAAPLVFGGLIYASWFRGARGTVAFVLPVAVLVAPWLWWASLGSHPDANSLFAYYTGYGFPGVHWAIVSGNLRYFLDSFDLLYLLPLLPGLALFVFGFTVIGMIASINRSEIFSWCFFLLSLVSLLAWPFQPVRYAAPLVPLLMLFLFRGMKASQVWIEAKSGESGLGILFAKLTWCPVLAILLVDGIWLSSYLLIRDDQTTRGTYGRRLPFGWSGFAESFAWIRANTEPDDLLATAYDPMYYLYTGRRAIRPALHRPASYFYPYGVANPDVGSVDDIKPQLAQLRVKYLIADPLEGYAEGNATLKLFDQLVQSYGDQAKKVFTSSDGKHRIYRLAVE